MLKYGTVYIILYFVTSLPMYVELVIEIVPGHVPVNIQYMYYYVLLIKTYNTCIINTSGEYSSLYFNISTVYSVYNISRNY